MGRPTAAQLDKINRFAREPLSEANAHVHKFRLIGTRYMPGRLLQIDVSLLFVYKKFVESGDVVQIADHSFGGGRNDNITLPFGRFFEGEIVQDGDAFHLDGVMYMKAGQKTYLPGGFTTDDISEQLDAGILHDSSVAISWGKSECSICGSDIRDHENCQHWPGMTYRVQGKDMLCFVLAKPAEKDDRSAMFENSLVCAGAYPDAGALGAAPDGVRLSVVGAGKAGDVSPQYREIVDMPELKLVQRNASVFCLLSAGGGRASLLVMPESMRDEARFRDLCRQTYPVGGAPEGRAGTVLVCQRPGAALATAARGVNKEQKGSDQGVDLIQRLCEFLGCAQDELFAMVEGLRAEISAAQVAMGERDKEIARLAPFEDRVKELEPLAEIGRQYRTDLIDDALRWGVKAYANSFNMDVNRKMLSAPGMGLDDIKAVKAQYEEVARQTIQTGRVGAGGGLGGEDRGRQPDDSLYSIRDR